MNILHVVNIYFVLPYFIGDQFKYFKEKGYNMNVACSPSEYLADFAKEQGFAYIETPVNILLRYGISASLSKNKRLISLLGIRLKVGY